MLMHQVLRGAMHVRVATETLHPLYELFVPLVVEEGLCNRPGIQVACTQTASTVILKADVEQWSST